jgi:hypothetical protein
MHISQATTFRSVKQKLTRGGLFMKGRDTLFSAFKEVDLTTLLVGAKADAEARMAERAAIFIMVG